MTDTNPSFNWLHELSFRIAQVTILSVFAVPIGLRTFDSWTPLYATLALMAAFLTVAVAAERLEGRSVIRQGDAVLVDTGVKSLNEQYRNEWDDPSTISVEGRGDDDRP